MTDRNEVYAVAKTLNAKIATLKSGAMINQKYGHEIDGGYGKLETATDAIKPLARMVHFLRHEALTVSVNVGSYDFALRNLDRADMLVDQIGLIEGRVA
jgi:hypothetical protein